MLRLDSLEVPGLRSRRVACSLLILSIAAAPPIKAAASDHADIAELAKYHARIGDFYAFTRKDELVLAMTIFTELPGDPGDFRFNDEVVYRFLIDRDSEVSFDDPKDLARLGGTIVNPGEINADVVIEIDFMKNGRTMDLSVTGLDASGYSQIDLFVGVRDEPFIRGRLIGANVAAIVVSIPVSAVIGNADPQTLLLWSTTEVIDPSVDTNRDLCGRPYSSQEDTDLNSLHPKEHQAQLGLAPDVLIFDLRREAAYPNGRELRDDVVDIIGIPGHDPNPRRNDKRFSRKFPYLATPHD